MNYLNHIYNDRRRYFLNKRNQNMKQLNADIDILFLGDSLTENFNINRYIVTNKIIVNSGVGGDITETLNARLEEDALALKPKEIILMIGINDIRTFFTNECLSPNLKTEDDLKNVIPQNIINIINRIKGAGIKVYWTRILPVNEFNINCHYINSLIEEINDSVESNIKDVTVIKHDVLKVYDGRLNANYTYDGVHLHDDGYLQLAENLTNYVSFFK